MSVLENAVKITVKNSNGKYWFMRMFFLERAYFQLIFVKNGLCEGSITLINIYMQNYIGQPFTVAPGEQLGFRCLAQGQGHFSRFLPVLRIEPATFRLVLFLVQFSENTFLP